MCHKADIVSLRPGLFRTKGNEVVAVFKGTRHNPDLVSRADILQHLVKVLPCGGRGTSVFGIASGRRNVPDAACNRVLVLPHGEFGNFSGGKNYVGLGRKGCAVSGKIGGRHHLQALAGRKCEWFAGKPDFYLAAHGG